MRKSTWLTDQRKHVLSVPVEAVDGSGKDGRVLRVSPSGELEAVRVQLGIESAQRIEVRGGSLQDGDQLVVVSL